MAFQLPLQMKDNAGLIIVAVNLAMLVSANAEGQATAGKDWVSLYFWQKKVNLYSNNFVVKGCSIYIDDYFL